MAKNFLRMGTRDRLRLVLFVVLCVGAVLLWPILFCAKVDGDTSASWVALWTPLWIYDALGESKRDRERVEQRDREKRECKDRERDAQREGEGESMEMGGLTCRVIAGWRPWRGLRVTIPEGRISD